ncbi:chaplin [Streptomyces platensis]|uniref:chaplin n=1 Tax=Streptomyces platensis TaxID=58346 RepID=UPI002B1CD238|nr:chaplin [Streptomyces platensis]
MSAAYADAGAAGGAANSPGVVSGNAIQVPIHIPVNVCGNTINIVGLLNPAFGNTCLNGGIERRVEVHRHHHVTHHHHVKHAKKKHHVKKHHAKKHHHHKPSGGVHTGGGGLVDVER